MKIASATSSRFCLSSKSQIPLGSGKEPSPQLAPSPLRFGSIQDLSRFLQFCPDFVGDSQLISSHIFDSISQCSPVLVSISIYARKRHAKQINSKWGFLSETIPIGLFIYLLSLNSSCKRIKRLSMSELM